MNSPHRVLVARRRGGSFRRFSGAFFGLTLVVVSLVQMMTTSAAGASVPPLSCPPDCGRVAAGDPLLIPFIALNPGEGWLALPAADVQSYASDLRRNLSRSAKGKETANVAAAKWTWLNNRFSLLIVLVSAGSLETLHLADPATNAQDLCAASRGSPGSQLVHIAGIPTSVSGQCLYPQGSPFHGATLVTFRRGNVAVLIQISSRTATTIDQRTAALVAQQQLLSLPSGGVPVSDNGPDVGFLLLWLLFLVVVVLCLVRCIRRQASWRGPLDAVAAAWRRRAPALGVCLVAIVGAMAFSMLDAPWLHGLHQWFESGYNDFWRSWSSSADMTYAGGYGHIYKFDSALETAPTWLTLIAPISRAAFGLSFPYPSPVASPAAFWVAGPIFLAAMALPLCAGDRWMQFMGMTTTSRRLTVLGVMAITLPPIALNGHSEDLVALGAVLYGLVAALEGRHRAAGWWLGVALAFQFLAFFAVPIALILLTRRQWTGALVRMVVVPLSVLVVPLVSDPGGTVHQLVHQTVYFDQGFISPTWFLDPGVGAIIRLLIALVAIPAALVLARFLPEDRAKAANLVLWVLALLFVLRVFEPELLPYFLAPALALFPISASRRPWWRLAAVCALAVWLNWWLHAPVQGRWLDWSYLVVQLAVLAWLALPRLSPVPDTPPVRRKPGTPAPRARRPAPVRRPGPTRRYVPAGRRR